jgi:hypothetical protein
MRIFSDDFERGVNVILNGRVEDLKSHEADVGLVGASERFFQRSCVFRLCSEKFMVIACLIDEFEKVKENVLSKEKVKVQSVKVRVRVVN